MTIVRSETILAAMKALKMRDEDLCRVIINEESKSGKISQFDIDLVKEMSIRSIGRAATRGSCTKFSRDELKEAESKMSAVYENGSVIVLVTDEQANLILANEIKTILAVNNVALDTLFAVKLDMGVDDSLEDNIVKASSVIQRILKDI